MKITAVKGKVDGKGKTSREKKRRYKMEKEEKGMSEWVSKWKEKREGRDFGKEKSCSIPLKM